MLAAVLITLHLLIAAGLCGVVLLQRSEGGALGIGGGGGGGGFLTGRGTANLLTRVTAALAGAFFVTSMLLTMLAQSHNVQQPVVGTTPAPAKSAPVAPVAPTTPVPPASTDNTPRGGVLDKLQGVPPPSPPAAPAAPPSK